MGLFKDIKLGGRLGSAQSALMNKKYEDARNILLNIIKSEPPDYLVYLTHSLLGQAEYHLSNHTEAMKSLELCIKDSVENPNRWSSDELVKELERIHWFYKKSEAEHNRSN